MPNKFSLSAALNLTGPIGIKPVVQRIQKELSGIKADVVVRINPASLVALEALNKNLVKLNTNLTKVTTTAKTAESALTGLGRSFTQFSGGIRTGFKDINTLIGNLDNITTKAGKSLDRQVGGAIAQTSTRARKLRVDVNDAATEFEAFGRLAALSLRRFAAFSIATGAVFGLVNAVTQGVRAFVDFDRELIRLQQVTGKSRAQLKDLSNEITRLSVTLGVSSSELTQVAVTFAQAGLSIRDSKVALDAIAKSARLPSFGDMIKTAESAIAIFQQFKLGTEDLGEALGSINKVAADFAVEAQDITVAIQKSGSVFAAAANVKDADAGKKALNEFIAVFTSIRQTTRESADTIATGLRTIGARLQRPETIKFLKEFGIELQDTEDKFVGLFEATQRIGKALNDLDPRDIRFAEIVEEIGGIRQLSKVIPAIQQTEVAQRALTAAQQGALGVNEQVTKGLDGLAVRFAQVREEFLALIRSIGESRTFNVLVDGLLGIASAAVKMVDALEPAIPLLAILAGQKLFSKAGPLVQTLKGAFNFRATGQAANTQQTTVAAAQAATTPVAKVRTMDVDKLAVPQNFVVSQSVSTSIPSAVAPTRPTRVIVDNLPKLSESQKQQVIGQSRTGPTIQPPLFDDNAIGQSVTNLSNIIVAKTQKELIIPLTKALDIPSGVVGPKGLQLPEPKRLILPHEGLILPRDIRGRGLPSRITEGEVPRARIQREFFKQQEQQSIRAPEDFSDKRQREQQINQLSFLPRNAVTPLAQDLSAPVVKAYQTIIKNVGTQIVDDAARISPRGVRRIFEQDRGVSNQFINRPEIITPSTFGTRLDAPPLSLAQVGGNVAGLHRRVTQEVALNRQGGRQNPAFTVDSFKTGRNINRNQLNLESVFGQRILRRGIGGGEGQLDPFTRNISGKTGSINENVFQSAAGSANFNNNFKAAAQELIPLATSERGLTLAMNAYLKEISLGSNQEVALAKATEVLTRERLRAFAKTQDSVPAGPGRLARVGEAVSGFLNKPIGTVKGVGKGIIRGLKNSASSGGLGLAAILGGGLIESAAQSSGNKGLAVTGGVLGGALGGAGTGALIGSAIPVIGTAIGAAVGGVVGGLSGLSSALSQFNDKGLLKALSDSAEEVSRIFKNLSKTAQSDIDFAFGGRFQAITGSARGTAGESRSSLRTNLFGASSGDFQAFSGRQLFAGGFNTSQFAQTGEIRASAQDDAQRILTDIGNAASAGGESKLFKSADALKILALNSESGAAFLSKLNRQLERGVITQQQYDTALEGLTQTGREIAQQTIDQAKKQRELNDAYREALQPLELLIQRFTALGESAKFIEGKIGVSEIGTASRVAGLTGSAQSALSGPARALNVAGNLGAASSAEISRTLSTAAGVLGQNEASPGKTFGRLGDTIRDLGRVTTELPQLLQRARGQAGLAEGGTAQSFIERGIRDSFGSNDELKNALLKKVQEVFGREGSDLEKIDQLLSEDLGSIGGELSEAAKTALQGVLQTIKASMDSFIKTVNESAQLQASATRGFADAQSILAESQFEQRKLRGGTISVADVEGRIQQRVRALAGSEAPFGVPGAGADPVQLQRRLGLLQERRGFLEGRLNQTTSAADAQVLGDSLIQTNAAIINTRDALTELATSTEKASAIREKLNELEKIRSGSDNIFEALITGSNADLTKILKEQLSFLTVQGGGGDFNKAGFGRDALAGLRRAQGLQTTEQAAESQRQFFNQFVKQQGLNVQDPRLLLSLQRRGENSLERPLLGALADANSRQAGARGALAGQDREAANVLQNAGVQQLNETIQQLRESINNLEKRFGDQDERNQDRQVSADSTQAQNRLAEALERNPIPESIAFDGRLATDVRVVGGTQIGRAIVEEVVPEIETLIDAKLRTKINFLTGDTRGRA